MGVDRISPGYSSTLDHTLQTPPTARNTYGNIYAGGNAQVHCGDKNYYGPQEMLKCVENAEFNSYGQVHTACHPVTRKDLLRGIKEWAQRPDGKSIYWLNGMAGTGKSTISYTIAEWLSLQRDSDSVSLGASFFFKRGEGDRASAALFFPTIVRQLVHKDPSLAKCVDDVLQTDPYICRKSLGEQFNKLLREPLHVLTTHDQPYRYVVVVDALDECDNEGDIQTVLQLWSSLSPTTKAHLRLFLTSRPELPIRLGFKRMVVNIHQDVVLHEVPQSIIEHDIHAFLKDAFNEIREEYNLEPASSSLPDNWPGDQILQILTDMAVPLFIVAATICRFIRVSYAHPSNRLKTILQSRKMSHLSQMSQVYLSVLQQMKVALGDTQGAEQLYYDFRTVVGSIVALAEPISRKALASLLDVPSDTIALRLRPLHSVLQVPLDDEALIRPLHLSFSEYLTSPEVQNHPYGVDKPAIHGMLWRHCLRLLSEPNGLQENVCGLSFPGQMRYDISPAKIGVHLPPAVSYACQYWVYHLQHSTTQLHDDDEIHNFLQQHFLHWLEALSLLDRLADTTNYIEILRSNISPQISIRIFNFLKDARQFVLANRFIANQAPLQLYSSAIIFSPQSGIVREVCGQTPVWIKKCPITPLMWNLELQKLEGHTSSVQAVAFSPDGSQLVSGSDDGTVRLWNAETGQEVQKLEGHTGSVWAVAFSPDGSQLASGSSDQTVRLWDAKTGHEVQKLEGHTDWVRAVAFSPDGSQLVSGSDDRTVRLWDAKTGHEVQKLEGHTDWVQAVAFSPDGSQLVSESSGQTVRLWDAKTGHEVQKLEGHTGSVRAVAFSPDGSQLVSESSGQTVRLWDEKTGWQIQVLKDYTSIREITFTKYSQTLLASRDNIPTQTSPVPSKSSEPRGSNSLRLKDDWIEYGDKKLLWLPHEYRSDVSAIRGNVIAIGRRSGVVSFLQIAQP